MKFTVTFSDIKWDYCGPKPRPADPPATLIFKNISCSTATIAEMIANNKVPEYWGIIDCVTSVE